MNITLASESHIPGMIALLKQVGDVHHQIRPDIFRAGAQKYDEKDLALLLKDENCPIFVAADGEKVLGYCFCRIEEIQDSSVLTDRKEIYIDDLCVDEVCRGRGIAKALYEHTCTWAKDLGFDFVTLNVWCGNDGAMAFYEKMGLMPRKIFMEVKL